MKIDMVMDKPFELSYSSTPEEIKAALHTSKRKSKDSSNTILPRSILDRKRFSTEFKNEVQRYFAGMSPEQVYDALDA